MRDGRWWEVLEAQDEPSFGAAGWRSMRLIVEGGAARFAVLAWLDGGPEREVACAHVSTRERDWGFLVRNDGPGVAHAWHWEDLDRLEALCSGELIGRAAQLAASGLFWRLQVQSPGTSLLQTAFPRAWASRWAHARRHGENFTRLQFELSRLSSTGHVFDPAAPPAPLPPGWIVPWATGDKDNS